MVTMMAMEGGSGADCAEELISVECHSQNLFF